MNMLVTHELSPIYDNHSKILILGSIPSVNYPVARLSGLDKDSLQK